MNKHAATLRRFAPILFLGLLTIVWGLPAQALDVPRLQGHVNDYAGMLTSASRQQLEAVLSDFERQESTQIVVLTVPSLEGDALEDFSMRVAEAWKIGQKGTDNGAILLVAKNDRKIRIEVGYGLEGRLTDLVAGRIIRNVITPYFRAGQFDQGITQGVGAMIEAVKGEFSAPATPSASQKSQKGTPIFAVLGLLFLVNALGRVSRFMGAAAGAVLFPIAGALFFRAAPLLLVGLVPIGILAGLILSRVGGALSSGTNSHIHRGGGGGYWGGGFGGGGFSSGGFGGFSGGGGGFGGGGASGGW